MWVICTSLSFQENQQAIFTLEQVTIFVVEYTNFFF